MNQCHKMTHSGYYCFKYEYDKKSSKKIVNSKHSVCIYEVLFTHGKSCKFNLMGFQCTNKQAHLACEMTDGI